MSARTVPRLTSPHWRTAQRGCRRSRPPHLVNHASVTSIPNASQQFGDTTLGGSSLAEDQLLHTPDWQADYPLLLLVLAINRPPKYR